MTGAATAAAAFTDTAADTHNEREIMKSKAHPSKNIDDLIVEIMRLALKVNRETSSDVFFEFHGHVNSIGVQIHYGGWKADKDSDYLQCFYLDDTLSPDRFEKCGQIISTLKELLEEKNNNEREEE